MKKGDAIRFDHFEMILKIVEVEDKKYVLQTELSENFLESLISVGFAQLITTKTEH